MNTLDIKKTVYKINYQDLSTPIVETTWECELHEYASFNDYSIPHTEEEFKTMYFYYTHDTNGDNTDDILDTFKEAYNLFIYFLHEQWDVSIEVAENLRDRCMIIGYVPDFLSVTGYDFIV